MPNLTLWNEAHMLWFAFMLYFLAQYREIRPKAIGVVGLFSWERLCLLLSVPLVFFPVTHFGALAIRFHHSRAAERVGFILVIVGLAFAAWARDLLGRNWSGRVVIQAGHQLVTAGPYAYIRHPLYTGLLVGMVGMVLLCGHVGSLPGLCFAIGFTWLKAKREERLLEGEFGPAYAVYRLHTGALLPRLSHV